MAIVITGKNVIKDRGFCPNPVAKYGIPEYADSVTFPEVEGTRDHLEWWEEQINYCLSGYETGGLTIPGRYYYYLNFSYMYTVGRGFHHPDFVDTDYDYFLLVEYCKKTGKGIISIKARRKGLSFKANKGIIEYGTKFLGDMYGAGICAGLQDYADDFAYKLFQTENLTAPELRLNTLRKNTEEIIYGYEEQDQHGKFVHAGSQNQVLIRTAFQSGNIFKGLALDDCIFEESGEFPNLWDTYEATKWCFMDGDKMIGTPYIYGTGGNMNSSSKDFAMMWNEAQNLNLERFWVPGTKIHKPHYRGSLNTEGEVEHYTPNIDYEHKDKKDHPERLLGCEDYLESERNILLERKKLSKAKNKKALTDHIQNLPLTVEEAFISGAENNYDSAILNGRIYDLMGREELYQEMVIEPKTDDKGNIITPIQPFFRLPNRNSEGTIIDPDWKIVQVYKFPKKDVRFLDAIGIDSYDQDQSNTSASLGSVVVDRQFMASLDYYGPICLYYSRPPRKEQFYMIALLISMAYGSPNQAMCDAGSPRIIDFFVENKGESLLAYRPKSLESPNSEQMHTYGMKFTIWNRPILESLVQSQIVDNAENWPFPLLLKDCTSYNTGDNENDQDAHDAYMLALSVHQDRKLKPIEEGNHVKKTNRVRKVSKEGYVYWEEQKEDDNQRFGGDLFMDMLASGKLRK